MEPVIQAGFSLKTVSVYSLSIEQTGRNSTSGFCCTQFISQFLSKSKAGRFHKHLTYESVSSCMNWNSSHKTFSFTVLSGKNSGSRTYRVVTCFQGDQVCFHCCIL